MKIEDAIGSVLCHDMTRIVKGEIKDAVFRKGHVLTEEDIPVLLSMGKEHTYVYEEDESMVHEDDAALILSNLCINDNMTVTEVKEGKMELVATCDGLFQVDVEKLNNINDLDDIMIATRMGNLPVKAGDKLAGMRVIPLVIEEDKLNKAKEVAGDMPILKLTPFKSLKAGIITTGNEVYYGRIKDTFTPVIEGKLKDMGIEVVKHLTSRDDIEEIKSNILEIKKDNIDLIICTGGMSVDPDDLTPAAIKSSGANIVTYGAPVLPGAMFLLAYFDDGSTIMGLPGCAMYEKHTIFDIMLPYVSAGIQVNKSHIKKLGYGGLCLDCPECNYPNCQFGKGV
ncbi:MAG: molybdopterin-binding protein [Tissierella sp.]|uniref:molybdopterin-binding protein n=1 Tax=Tissierella sp. TaxID=41274 RepID=UPI003F9B93ED